MKKVLLGIVALLLAGTVVYLLLPSGPDAADGLYRTALNEPTPVITFNIDPMKQSNIDLNHLNTIVEFECTRTTFGVNSDVSGGWAGDFEGQMVGGVIIDNESREPLLIEIKFTLASVYTANTQLKPALISQGLFRVDQHPDAYFTSTDIHRDPEAAQWIEGGTHFVEGNFRLNGVEKSIRFPIQIDFDGKELIMNGSFALERRPFNVIYEPSGGLGILSDRNISPLVAMFIEVDTRGLSMGDGDRPSYEEELDGPRVAQTSVNIDQLPEQINVTLPDMQIDITLVLVPGDAQSGIAPFYMGKHEVTWDQYMPWVAGKDLPSERYRGRMERLNLRPSAPWAEADRGFGMYNRPVLGVQRRAAVFYCRWLSEQTNLRFRLPTEKEWEHAYVRGGGDPNNPPQSDQADRIAVYLDNAFDTSSMRDATRPVGSKEPNELGIHDMAGNVTEWVIHTADDDVARGGSFRSPLEETGIGRHIEDETWNQSDPQMPKSIWWYQDAEWAGFRVIVEIDDALIQRYQQDPH